MAWGQNKLNGGTWWSLQLFKHTCPPSHSFTSAHFIIPNLPANKLYPTKKKDYTVTTPSHKLRLHVNYKILILKNQDPLQPHCWIVEQNIWVQLGCRGWESLKVGHVHLDFKKGLCLFKTTDKVDRVRYFLSLDCLLTSHNKQSLPTSHDNQSLSYQVAALKKWSTTTNNH